MTKRIFALILSTLLVFSFSVVGYASDDCPHDFGYFEYEAVAPTCGKDGHIKYRECKLGCGQLTDSRRNPLTWEQIVIPATGNHTYGENGKCTVCGYGVECAHEGGIATCIEKAVCSLCGKSYGEYNYLNHASDETVVVNLVEADCENAGYSGDVYFKCCNTLKESGKVIGAKGHTETVIKGTDATCTSDGLTDGVKCSVCGETVVAQEVITASGHAELKRQENIVNPTCGKEGSYTLVTYCSTCNEVIRSENKTIPATGNHSFDYEVEGTKVLPTCTKDGSVVMKCSCGETKTFVLLKDTDAHSWSDTGITVKNPTCTEKGEVRYSCMNEDCNASYNPEIPVDSTAHKWSSWTTVYDSDCVNKGIRVRICEHNSSHKEQEEIELRNHSLVRIGSKDSTCTDYGNIEYWFCTVCEKKFADSTCVTEIFNVETALKEHRFSVYSYDNNATCNSDGTETSVCDMCKVKTDTRTKYGTKLQHKFTVYISDNNATCAVDGTKTAVCDLCKTSYDTVTDIGSKDTVAHTPDATGQICTVCSKEFEGVHSWSSEKVVIKHATCVDAGEKAVICLDCGAEKIGTSEVIPAVGHSSTADWQILSAPTCKNDGLRVKVCKECYFVLDETMLKTEHYDADSDNLCNACGAEIKAETAENGGNDTSAESGIESECTCNCHKTGFAKIIFSITNFFQKLFGINKICACGEPH